MLLRLTRSNPGAMDLKMTVNNDGGLEQDGDRGLRKGGKKIEENFKRKRWRSKNTQQKTQKQIKILFNISL